MIALANGSNQHHAQYNLHHLAGLRLQHHSPRPAHLLAVPHQRLEQWLELSNLQSCKQLVQHLHYHMPVQQLLKPHTKEQCMLQL